MGSKSLTVKFVACKSVAGHTITISYSSRSGEKSPVADMDTSSLMVQI